MSLSTSTLEANASHANEATASTSPDAATEAAAWRKPGHEPKCCICADKRRAEIDRHLLANSLRRTAALFGLSKSALHRHRDSHIPELIAAGEQILNRRLALAAPKLRERLEDLYAETLGFFHSTNGSDNPCAKGTLSILTRQLGLALKIASAVPATPAIGPDAVEILARTVLDALAPHPEIRAQVAASLRAVEAQLGFKVEAA